MSFSDDYKNLNPQYNEEKENEENEKVLKSIEALRKFVNSPAQYLHDEKDSF